VPEGEKKFPGRHRHMCHNFMASPAGEIRTGSDAGEHMWVTPEEAIKMDTAGWTRTVIGWYLRRKK
jgi:hypothetical protein